MWESVCAASPCGPNHCSPAFWNLSGWPDWESLHHFLGPRSLWESITVPGAVIPQGNVDMHIVTPHICKWLRRLPESQAHGKPVCLANHTFPFLFLTCVITSLIISTPIGTHASQATQLESKFHIPLYLPSSLRFLFLTTPQGFCVEEYLCQSSATLKDFR